MGYKMTLKEWLKQERRPMNWMARELKYKSAATVCNWITGKSSPSLENIQAIEKITKGKVKFTDWAKIKDFY